MNTVCRRERKSDRGHETTQTVEPVSCPYCKSNELDDLGECCALAELASDQVPQAIKRIAERIDGSRLNRCHRCQLLFRAPQLNRDELTPLYNNLPETIWQYRAETVGSWVRARRRLLELYPSNQPIAILDIGAFDGGFLKQLPKNWNKSAVEPSPVGREKLREAEIEIVGDVLENLPHTRKTDRFDVVATFDVFEHLPDPADALDRLARLVKPSGRLMISTCSADHWTWKLLRGKHWYLHTAQHLCFATPTFFRRWSDGANLVIESLIRHPHKIDSWRTRVTQCLEVTHGWARLTGRTALMRAIQSLPGFGQLAHKQSIVFANTLHDHQLVVFRRPPDSMP